MSLRIFFLAFWLASAPQSSPAVSPPPLQGFQQNFEAGRYAQARRELETEISLSPQNAHLHFWLARSAYELSDFDAAVRAAERAAQLDPRNSDYQLWLGRAYGRKAEIESSFFLGRKTRQAFEAAVRLDPANIRARRDLAEFYIEAPWFVGGSKDKARQQVEAITQLDQAEGILALADFLRMQEQPQKAGEQYARLLALKPRKMEAYYEALNFYERQGDAAQMRRVIEAAEMVESSAPPLLYFRAVARVIAGIQFDQAEKELKTYIESAPNRSDLPGHGDAHHWRGKIHEQRGDYTGAAEQYRAALQLDPRSKRFREDLKRVEKKT
jgi:tetratricopeptide (TPR) repeat protein